MNHVAKRRSGFTIIELMLAMSFVSVLMLAIAMMIIQLTNIYDKGTTLRAVDQAGRAVSHDLQMTLAASESLDVGTEAQDGMDYKRQIQVGGQRNDPDGGRLCTGKYSFIWNTGHGLAHPVNTYETGDQEIFMVKVRDNGGQYCSDVSRKVKAEDATELLSDGDRELAVQSLSIVPVATDTVVRQSLYYITLELGTNDADSLTKQTSISTIDTSCKPPSDSASTREFCAVNKFEFTALTGNRGEQQ